MIPIFDDAYMVMLIILLPVGYRQRFDADFLEPVIIEYRKRG